MIKNLKFLGILLLTVYGCGAIFTLLENLQSTTYAAQWVSVGLFVKALLYCVAGVMLSKMRFGDRRVNFACAGICLLLVVIFGEATAYLLPSAYPYLAKIPFYQNFTYEIFLLACAMFVTAGFRKRYNK